MKNAIFITQLNGLALESNPEELIETVSEHEVEVKLEDGSLLGLIIDVSINYIEIDTYAGVRKEYNNCDVYIIETYDGDGAEINLTKTQKFELENFLQKNLF